MRATCSLLSARAWKAATRMRLQLRHFWREGSAGYALMLCEEGGFDLYRDDWGAGNRTSA